MAVEDHPVFDSFDDALTNAVHASRELMEARNRNAPEDLIRRLELTALTMLQRLSEVADQIE